MAYIRKYASKVYPPCITFCVSCGKHSMVLKTKHVWGIEQAEAGQEFDIEEKTRKLLGNSWRL